ncbi:MAG: hypothetical protein ACRENP_10560 [Longimicrobiales bacterium]
MSPEPDQDEGEFERWYAKHSAQLYFDPDPDNPLHFYDWRAAFRSGAEPDREGHWPSEFKREGHRRLVVYGVDTRTGQPVVPKLLPAPPPVAADATAVVRRPPPITTEQIEREQRTTDVLRGSAHAHATGTAIVPVRRARPLAGA